MNKKILKIAYLSLLFITFPGLSQDYWVDINAESNLENCVEVTPCSGFKKVLPKLAPGDVIYVADGIYESLLIKDIRGKISAPITIKAIGNNAYFYPNIKSKMRDTLEIRNSLFITIDGLKFVNAKRAAIRINNSSNITVKNTRIKNSLRWGIFTNHTNFISLVNNHITGPSKEHGIYISNSGDHISLIENKIFGALGCGIHMNGDLSMGGGSYTSGDGIISDVFIHNNLIEGVGKIGGGAINLDGVENIKITENIIWDVNSAGITVFKQNGAIVSRNVDVTNNIIKLNKKSRWGLIAGEGSGPIFFTNNIIVSDNTTKGAFELKSIKEASSSVFDKIKQKLGIVNIGELPLISNNNIFALTGNIASLDDVFYKKLSDLQSVTDKSDLEKNSKQYNAAQISMQLTKYREQLLFSEIAPLIESLLHSQENHE